MKFETTVTHTTEAFYNIPDFISQLLKTNGDDAAFDDEVPKTPITDCNSPWVTESDFHLVTKDEYLYVLSIVEDDADGPEVRNDLTTK